MIRHQTEIAVVGAGLAGLTAAYDLHRKGHDVVVLEAQDRVGGRTLSVPIAGDHMIDIGGTWHSTRHRHLAELAEEVGAGTHPTYDRGKQLLELEGHTHRVFGGMVRLAPLALLDIATARTRLNQLAKTVPPEAPWLAERAGEWDATTLGSWIANTLRTATGRALMTSLARSIWAAEPHEINLLQALAYIHGVGSVEAMTSTAGLLANRFGAGAQELSHRMAAALGSRVLLSRPVRAISQREGSVEIMSDTELVEAEQVVVALPPPLVRTVEFDPPLPPERLRIFEGLPMGDAIKVIVAYPEPFWRAAGLSGQAGSDNGPIAATVDMTPAGGGPGVLVGVIPGEWAQQFRTMDAVAREARVLACLARLYGPEAEACDQYIEKDWSEDPWARGGFFGLAGTGVLTGPFRTVNRATGRIHWAGAETDFESFGQMDGAVASGRRAAREASVALRERQPIPS
ncbi:FAD-dependent oxidoreductase [Nocardia sp. JMUB6875]|uniref:flavin monoamine oxidase family protein n=1 Tax=Nocardia sp. JMUB6875 TaxID=3158170 RepID=UPI0032E7E748